MKNLFELSKLAKEKQYRIEVFEIVDSTNELAKTKILDALDASELDRFNKLFILSQEQRQGRGRRGRSWYSPKGNLYVSLILTKDVFLESVAQLGFVASLSVLQALQSIAERFSFDKTLIQVKWPNDVFLAGGKISGNLLEIVPHHKKNAVILGVGVNICEKYQNPDYKTASLHEYGLMVEANEVFKEFSFYWAKNFYHWLQPQGGDYIRHLWLDHAAFIGQPIAVKIGNRQLSGQFETIDPYYRLLLRSRDGKIKAISSGDVILENIASYNCSAR